MANKIKKTPGRVIYFDEPGKENLPEIVQTIKRALRTRADLRDCKIVVFTAHGAGAYLAHTKLIEYAPRIVAVTFPNTFTLKRGEDLVTPTIDEDMMRFFVRVGIQVLTPQSLPFDLITGIDAHNQAMKLTRDTLGIFGGGFSLCIQAVLRACDAGLVSHGEYVIAFSADTALLVRASPTTCFLAPNIGLEVSEILCKTRTLPRTPATTSELSATPKMLEGL